MQKILYHQIGLFSRFETMKKGQLKKWILGLLLVPVFLFAAVSIVVYFQQDNIVQNQLSAVNQTFKGKIEVGDSHLALFQNFPYLSLKIDDVRILEDKTDTSTVILDVADIYVGFNILDIIAGDYDIQSIIVEDGFFDVVLHTDGTTNIQNALATGAESEASGAPLNIHLKKIELRNLEFHQREEATQLDIATTIEYAKGGFETSNDQIASHIDTEFILDIIENGDTTYFSKKHFELHTDLTFNQATGLISFEPSGITMEHGDFELVGSIDTKNDMTLDLAVKGTKPSFDMFIAFAPTEIIPVLERYENAGKIYFNALVKGATTNGKQPFIEANFGASEAFLENTMVDKRINDMGFSGYFTNGANRDLTTMEFSMKDISARVEKGQFVGALSVKNFEVPDIEMELDANFDLPFWADFLNLDEIRDIKGRVEMHMKFHDIIDLDNPAKALEELNQAYYAELIVEDFSLQSSDLPAPINDLNIHLEMNGKKAEMDLFSLVLGNSDLSITGFLSDLPAIVHHTTTPVRAHLEIESDLLDFIELTKFNAEDSTGFNEQIKNLKLAFSFDALGNAFTEYKYLPKGEFFIDDLYADLQNYPHTLHDFHADVFIKDKDLKIVDFTGNIDSTDFHFNGVIQDYSFWMQEQLNGAVHMDVTLKSDLFRLNDLFTYGGENYVPKDYRHEQVENLELHFDAGIVYDSSQLSSVELQLDKWAGKMHLHPMHFEDFSGNFKLEDEHLMVKGFHGKLGKTIFDIDMNYFLGEDVSKRKRDDLFTLASNYIDYDELFNFQLKDPGAPTDTLTEKTTANVAAHAEAFNIFEIPFTDMRFNVAVGHFIYHRYDLQNIKAEMRTTNNHFIYLDTLSLDAAGGNIAMNGYFNGSDPKHIYLKPKMKVTNIDLDQLLFKFENFGQDELVSDNLHGKLTADIWGNIRVYPDLIPDLDQSEIHLDAVILNGSLQDYEPMLLLSDYFGDKDITNIRFDTIQNHMDLTQGLLSIPNMTIESTLGHLEMSGTQDMNDNINYFIRIPWSLVKEASKNKLFGAKKDDPSAEDEIIEVDPNEKIRYLNINMVGTIDDYDIKMRKPKRK